MPHISSLRVFTISDRHVLPSIGTSPGGRWPATAAYLAVLKYYPLFESPREKYPVAYLKYD